MYIKRGTIMYYCKIYTASYGRELAIDIMHDMDFDEELFYLSEKAVKGEYILISKEAKEIIRQAKIEDKHGMSNEPFIFFGKSEDGSYTYVKIVDDAVEWKWKERHFDRHKDYLGLPDDDKYYDFDVLDTFTVKDDDYLRNMSFEFINNPDLIKKQEQKASKAKELLALNNGVFKYVLIVDCVPDFRGYSDSKKVEIDNNKYHSDNIYKCLANGKEYIFDTKDNSLKVVDLKEKIEKYTFEQVFLDLMPIKNIKFETLPLVGEDLVLKDSRSEYVVKFNGDEVESFNYQAPELYNFGWGGGYGEIGTRNVEATIRDINTTSITLPKELLEKIK